MVGTKPGAFSCNEPKIGAALVTVGKAVNSVLNITQVLDIILSSSLELLGADGGSIMLLENPDELRAVCVRGNVHAEGARVRLGESIAGYVAQQREPLLIAGPASQERFKNLVRKLGLVKYWRARGWPEFCHPTTGDDFVCA